MSDILEWLGIGSNLTSSVSTIGGTSVGVAAASSEGLRAELVETSVFCQIILGASLAVLYLEVQLLRLQVQRFHGLALILD